MKRGNICLENARGQIWVETVIYTLIAMVLIGLVLGYATPKIEEFRDKASIEKTINILNQIDTTIEEIRQKGSGNTRVIDFIIGDGQIKIDGVNDSIVFEMDSRYEYSEPGETFTENGFSINTEDEGKYKKITITKNYSYNLTYDGEDQSKTVSRSTTSYTISLLNNGFAGGTSVIDVSIS